MTLTARGFRVQTPLVASIPGPVQWTPPLVTPATGAERYNCMRGEPWSFYCSADDDF
jgi:hypothetical protein